MSTEAPDPPAGQTPAGPAEASPAAAPRQPEASSADRGGRSKIRAGGVKIEQFVVRLIITAGIIGIGVAIAAIMRSQNSQGWLIGLVVSVVSVVLAALLWSRRRL